MLRTRMELRKLAHGFWEWVSTFWAQPLFADSSTTATWFASRRFGRPEHISELQLRESEAGRGI